MKIKSVFRILNEIRYVKSVLKSYSNVLVRGKYYQYNSFRALTLNSPSVKGKAHLYFDENVCGNVQAAIANFLNRISFFNNKNKYTTEEYDGFYIANNYDRVREIKLFSFKNSKILTICTSVEEANKQIEQYETFGKAYNMPRVKKSDKYETAFEISMVNLKEDPGSDRALENVCLSTIQNNPSIDKLTKKSVKDLLEFSFNDKEINFYLQRIVDKIDPSLMNLQIPLCIQHGDLSMANIIYGECDGKTDFWWIDWEHAKERIFFYDYFFYIIISIRPENMKIFDCYIKGESCRAFEKMFEHFGLEFHRDKMFDYFLIFAIPFLIERVCSIGGLPILKRNYELIEAMEAHIKKEKR